MKNDATTYQAGRYYRTRSGRVAYVKSIGTDGMIHGDIPGVYAYTWWKQDGTHNKFPSDDLMDEVTND